MTRPRLFGISVAIAFLMFAAMPLRASDPVGVYALIDKVVFEPNEATATVVQVWGVFSLAVPRSSNGTQSTPPGSFGTVNNGDIYGAVQKGYLYLACTKGKEATCRNEWADLKSLAGKHEVAGFGSRYGTSMTVRKATDRPAAPDQYASNVGVVKLGSYSANPALAAALEAASRSK